jgi:hypothetical protein
MIRGGSRRIAPRPKGSRVASVDALAKVLPVLLLFGLGAVLRRRAFLRPATIEDLRRLVLYLTLPAALFLTFLRVTLEVQYALIVLSVFAACVAMLAAGPLIGRLVGVRSAVLPALLTGFEAGMIGYAIFGSVFGQAEPALPRIRAARPPQPLS